MEAGDRRDETLVAVVGSDVVRSGATGEAGGIDVLAWKWNGVASEAQRS